MKKKLLSIGIGLLAISFNAISQESIDSNQTSISQDENNILDNSTPKVEQNGNSKFLVNSK